ncbi:MAG: hypothetical protein SXA11_09885 [Cyanobacteriota bacterium]|nr:hypothetical protein [Cyanobacteriota bacterium]
MKKKPMMDDTEIRIRGIKALYESLGSVDALRFLSLLHQDSNDYVEISQMLYSKQTVDEIFDRAKQSWHEQS